MSDAIKTVNAELIELDPIHAEDKGNIEDGFDLSPGQSVTIKALMPGGGEGGLIRNGQQV